LSAGAVQSFVVVVIGTQTPFCNMELVPHNPFVLFVSIGTQTPFCNTEFVPHILDEVVGTHTPFCSTELVPHMLEEVVGTQTPFCNMEFGPQILVGGGWPILGILFSMITQ
jgi:hypothetical protein